MRAAALARAAEEAEAKEEVVVAAEVAMEAEAVAAALSAQEAANKAMAAAEAMVGGGRPDVVAYAIPPPVLASCAPATTTTEAPILSTPQRQALAACAQSAVRSAVADAFGGDISAILRPAVPSLAAMKAASDADTAAATASCSAFEETAALLEAELASTIEAVSPPVDRSLYNQSEKTVLEVVEEVVEELAAAAEEVEEVVEVVVEEPVVVTTSASKVHLPSAAEAAAAVGPTMAAAVAAAEARWSGERIQFETEISELKAQQAKDAESLRQNAALVKMLEESHAALIASNKQLLSEMSQMRAQHEADVKQFQMNFEELAKEVKGGEGAAKKGVTAGGVAAQNRRPPVGVRGKEN